MVVDGSQLNTGIVNGAQLVAGCIVSHQGAQCCWWSLMSPTLGPSWAFVGDVMAMRCDRVDTSKGGSLIINSRPQKSNVTPTRYRIPWPSPNAFCHCLSSFYNRKQCLHPSSEGRGNVVVLARYVLASLRSGEGERFSVNVLAMCRRKVMGPLTHIVLVFSGLLRNGMGSG